MSEVVGVEKSTKASLSLAALGIVFGDIGTSPLYAIRETLGGLPINITDVLGILSLIFWSLVLVISFKYLVILFRADNEGEGGILSLLALIRKYVSENSSILLLISVFGAGLLLGDGMLTPAISVVSAIEGLHVIVPSLSDWVVPLTAIILIFLFLMQSSGTAKIGFVFGPIILIWFLTIGILGLLQVIHNPIVLQAVNPMYAIEFFKVNGLTGYTLLGGVFLVVTGGEALYADLGHFGKTPIRLSWFCVVLPGLFLNYFGQGAFLLQHPEGIANPFYLLAPKWFLIPLLLLATLATIIASQAVISATFSLTRQAVLLGLYPHLPIVQTSTERHGQIYIPQMNMILAIGTLLLVFTFRDSNTLAHAYGIAVNLDMLLATLLVSFVAVKKWNWNIFVVLILFLFLVTIDLLFLGANFHKLLTKGWVPVVFASFCAFVMYTWHRGSDYLREVYYVKKDELSKLLKQFDYKSLMKIPNSTAIFITDIYDKSGGSFLHFLKLVRILPENILIVNYTVENIPYVSSIDRFELTYKKDKICELTLHYGYMDNVSIPQALYLANERSLLPFPVDIDATTYLIEIPNVVASRKRNTLLFYWQEKLFAFFVRNFSANINIEFYKLPYNRTIALGTYYMI